MKQLCIFSLLFISFTAMSQIYEYLDSKGNRVFSDNPPHYIKPNQVNCHGKRLTGNIYHYSQNKNLSMQTNQQVQHNSTLAITNATVPTVFMIHSPMEQQTFWNCVKIPVTLSIYPALQKIHHIQIIVDAAAYKEPASTTEFFIENLSQGTHTIQAQLLGANKEIIKMSPKVIFFVHLGAIDRRKG